MWRLLIRRPSGKRFGRIKYSVTNIRISTVRNDYVSRPLSKGILDGNLLAMFEELPISRQNEVTHQIGTDRAIVLKDWISLACVW